jgi:hypothetical protein
LGSPETPQPFTRKSWNRRSCGLFTGKIFGSAWRPEVAVAELLGPFVSETVTWNPLRVQTIAKAKIKADKIDSRVLAELLSADYLPPVWQPDRESLCSLHPRNSPQLPFEK